MDTLLWDLADTSHAMRRSFDRRAAVLGVTRAQWRVLAWLRREPNLRQVELADRIDVEPITLCRIVDRLEQAGLVERRHDPADRRAWRLMLTDKAKPMLDGLAAVSRDLTAEAFAGLSSDEVEQLSGLLARVRANVSEVATAAKVAG